MKASQIAFGLFGVVASGVLASLTGARPEPRGNGADIDEPGGSGT
jgi:hypothetical protein